jgi:Cdc6-like AAA superfamily ATPase
MTFQERKSQIMHLYSPSAPINSEKIFYGRKEQLERMHEAISERGQHIAIYGERGVGKTSLANIMEKQYNRAIPAKITCNHESTLAGIWRSVFKRIPIGYQMRKPIGFRATENTDEIVERIKVMSDMINQNENLTIDDIIAYLEYIKIINTNLLLIFDEFDQIQDKNVTNAFANIIKYLSDNVPNVTLLIVGIGSSIVDLIGEHQSIERCIRQILLERMSDAELSEIVISATESIEMKIDKKVLNKIVEYSSGFPHYTHLLGKYTTLAAIECEEINIKNKHFTTAMKLAIENVNESIKRQYELAILSTKTDTLFKDVLFACALVKTDEYGTFRATDIENYFSAEMNYQKSVQAFQYHLGKFCSEERGKILIKLPIAKSRTRYRFQNPLFKAFVRLKWLEQKNKQM